MPTPYFSGIPRQNRFAGEQLPLIDVPVEVPAWIDESYGVELDILKRFALESQTDGPTIQHAVDVLHAYRDFAQGKITPELMPAVLFVGVAESANSNDPSISGAGLRALHKFSKRLRENEWEYVSTVLYDTARIKRYGQKKRLSMKVMGEQEQWLKSRVDVPIPERAWEIKSVLTSPEDTVNFINQIQIEATIIKAVEELVRLQKREGSDRELYQRCFDVESFYAPYCDTLHFDVLSSALRSEVKRIRLEKTGETDKIDAARQEFAKLGDRDNKKRLAGVLAQLLTGGSLLSEYVVPDRSGHGMVYGESSLTCAESDGAVHVKWRVKSLGETATKPEVPPDLFGMKLIVEDRTMLTDIFATMMQHIAADEGRHVVLANSLRRQEPYHVRGGEKFIARTLGRLARIGMDEAEINEIVNTQEDSGKHNYEVAKVTLVYCSDATGIPTSTPVEVQIQTEEAELRSRVNKQGHGIYKAEKDDATEIRSKHIRAISDRSDDMRHMGLRRKAVASMVGGSDLRKRVARVGLR